MSVRKGPGGRRERWFGGRWVPEAELTPEQLRQTLSPPEVEEPSEPIRSKPKGPTARQQLVWDAVQEHGTQVAAAKALGCSQGAIQSGLAGYMKAMGMKGDLPGKLTGRFDSPPKPKGQRPLPSTLPPKPANDQQVEPEPGPDQAEPIKPPPLPLLPEPPELPELPMQLLDTGPAEVLVEVAWAMGYAAAVLRVVERTDSSYLSADWLRRMAAEAAQSLEAAR